MGTTERKSIMKTRDNSLKPDEVVEKLKEGLEAVKEAISDIKATESRAKLKFKGSVPSSGHSSDSDSDRGSGFRTVNEYVEEEEEEITISGAGPKVSSTDPHERKLARRLRILKRQNIVKKQKNEGNMEFTEEEGPKTHVEQQILKSVMNLEKMILEGNEQVTNVRVATDTREVKRRHEQGENKVARIKLVENEENETSEKLEEIYEKWTKLAKSNDPLDIYDEMEKQKERCEELVKSKDTIIGKLTDELNRCHEQFTRDQKKQKEDITMLSDRIDNHIKMMQQAYRQELLLLEEAIKLEQNELLEECNTEWGELYDDREKQEIQNMKKKFELILDYEKETDSIHVEHHEKFRDAKVRLEADIHILEQELEKVKALCLLNSEKLDYNFQILKKRDDENLLMKAHQKRRINKLQDVINKLKAQIDDIEQAVSVEKNKLSDKLIKLHTNIIDIGRKADHFAEVNDRKYHQVWNMNEKIAHELLEKILTADRIIHEQQLGSEWEAPLLSALSKADLPSYSTAMGAVDSLFRQKSYREISESSLIGLEEITTIKCKGDLLRHILERIADKSGFLVEEKIFELLYPFKKTEKVLVKIENIFMALGIQTTEDMEMLKKYFIPYLSCEICGYSPSTQFSEKTVDGDTDTIKDDMKIEDEPTKSTKLQFPDDKDRSSGNVDVLTSLQRGAKCSEEFDVMDPKSEKKKSDKGDIDESKLGTAISFLGTGASDNLDDDFNEHPDEIVKTTKDFLMNCDSSHPLKIDPIYVLKALRGFVAEFSKNKEIFCETMSERLAKDRRTVSRSLKPEDVTAYWERFTQIFSAEREKLWDALLIGLHKYHDILQERHKLNEQVQILRHQNEELKRLLQKYMKNYGSCGKRILPPLKPLPRGCPKLRCIPRCIRKC